MIKDKNKYEKVKIDYDTFLFYTLIESENKDLYGILDFDLFKSSHKIKKIYLLSRNRLVRNTDDFYNCALCGDEIIYYVDLSKSNTTTERFKRDLLRKNKQIFKQKLYNMLLKYFEKWFN